MPLVTRVARRVNGRFRRLFGQDDTRLLFRGNSRLFREALSNCRVYGEYGCGTSTIWCAQNCQATIVSVDSSADWIRHVENTVSAPGRLNMIHMDLGELGPWGRPVGYSHRNRFADYIAAPWSLEVKPDVVLVDGRFRVACFLYSLLSAEPGSVILFDDYKDRPHYHLVEEFAPLSDIDGTQALFRVPTGLDRTLIQDELARFQYVLD